MIDSLAIPDPAVLHDSTTTDSVFDKCFRTNTLFTEAFAVKCNHERLNGLLSHSLAFFRYL